MSLCHKWKEDLQISESSNLVSNNEDEDGKSAKIYFGRQGKLRQFSYVEIIGQP